MHEEKWNEHEQDPDTRVQIINSADGHQIIITPDGRRIDVMPDGKWTVVRHRHDSNENLSSDGSYTVTDGGKVVYSEPGPAAVNAAPDAGTPAESPAPAAGAEDVPRDRSEVADHSDPFGEAERVHRRFESVPDGMLPAGIAPSNIRAVESADPSIRFEGVDGTAGEAGGGVHERPAQTSTDRHSSSDTGADDQEDANGESASHTTFGTASDELSETESSSAKDDRDRDVDSDNENVEFG